MFSQERRSYVNTVLSFFFKLAVFADFLHLKVIEVCWRVNMPHLLPLDKQGIQHLRAVNNCFKILSNTVCTQTFCSFCGLEELFEILSP